MPVIKEEPIDCDLSVSDCLAPPAALVGDDIVPEFDIKKERDWVDDPSTLTLVSYSKRRQCLSSALSDHEVAYMKKCVVLVERLQVPAADLAQLRLPVVIKEERIDLDYEIFQDNMNMVIKEEPGLKQEDLLDGNLCKGELEMKDDQIISDNIASSYKAAGDGGASDFSVSDGDVVKILSADEGRAEVVNVRTQAQGFIPIQHIGKTILITGGKSTGWFAWNVDAVLINSFFLIFALAISILSE